MYRAVFPLLQVCDDVMDSGQEEGSGDGGSGSDEENVYGITTALNLSQHSVSNTAEPLDQQLGSKLCASGFNRPFTTMM